MSQPLSYSSASDNEQSNLNTLSIFYFILAGLNALSSLFALLYLGFGVVMALAGLGSGKKEGAAAGMGIGAFFGCIGFVLLAVIGTLGVLNYMTGKSLRQRKRLTLCYVMAGIACLWVPFGTILGVFTFVVLSKPGVKQSFH
jgi:hypothetical protein